MKRKRLVANVRPVGSPDRAEIDMLGIILDILWPAQANLVALEPFCH